MNTTVSVFGAGSWGTAVAVQIAGNGYQTLLWGRNPAHMLCLSKDRENKHYLSGLQFPHCLKVTSNLKEAVNFSDIVIICVPSRAFKTMLFKLKPLVGTKIQMAWTTKGFNPDDGLLLHQIVQQLFPDINAAVLSGPTFAQEVAVGLPSAITVASHSKTFASQLVNILHNPCFRVYTSEDIIGVQVGGAVKNVLAIAAGIADGLGFGANTRAVLITRGLQEIIHLGVKLGGQPKTFMGLAGLGDLLLTCTNKQSRNYRFGLALGQGKNKQEAIQQIAQETEGVCATRETYLLGVKHRIEMPIVEQTYRVLYKNLPPLTAVQNLLKRDLKAEF